MTSFDGLGNLDIWMEIVEYFRISPTDDSHSEVEEKQHALLQIALVSPFLTTPALDYLWETMTSLKPATKVLNSESEVVAFREGHWILGQPLTSDKVHSQAYSYLSRIRNLRVAAGSLEEMGVWSVLVMALGVKPLLPKLQSLYLNLAAAGTLGTWLYHLTTLLSPSLRLISFQNVSSTHTAGITSLHSTFCSQSSPLTCLKYRGHPFPDLLRQCLFFDQLEVLSLDFENNAIQRFAGSPAVVSDIFHTLSGLKYLKIDLRVFPLRDRNSSNKSPEVAPVLRYLHITGDAGDLQEFLINGMRSPTLATLDITVVITNGLNWKTLCDMATSNFPQMHSFSLEATLNSGVIPELLMQDISSITSRETMTSFRINRVPHCINDFNIPGLVRSWPELRSFTILNDHKTFFSAAILVELSRLSHLQELSLPLNLLGLQEELPIFTQVTDCPLREITVTKFSGAPSSLEGKINLSRNILLLFPFISKISGFENSQKEYLAEVEKLLGAFHRTIAVHAHRRALRVAPKKPPSTGLAMKQGD